MDLWWPQALPAALFKRFSIPITRAKFINFSPATASLPRRLLATSKYDLVFWLSDGSIPVSLAKKTIEFTQYEARLKRATNHPPMVWWRFLRVMFTEFWLRFVKLSAWRDGPEGTIDGIFQVFNSFIIYARLWEYQHS